ncbi:MAG: 5'-methylthioadenosine/adenosylhomocysteine nucleosidase [Chlamydiales bacterium]
MEEENHLLVNRLEKCVKATEQGLRTYFLGKLWGQNTVLACSRWGKVAAAATTTHLIVEHKIDCLFFTGVAGSIDPFLSIGDIVLAHNLVHYDMDASPFFPPMEVPLLGESAFYPDPALYKITKKAIKEFLTPLNFGQRISPKVCREFQITSPKLAEGTVASGDQFIAKQSKAENLKQRLPDAKCVEMEGAAVAQVCYEYGIPFVIIRTISDCAGDGAHIDFQRFVNKVASLYSTGIMEIVYENLHSARGFSTQLGDAVIVD